MAVVSAPRYRARVDGNPALIDVIRQEIAMAGGRIPFARFMELVLYHPQYGYYTAAARSDQSAPSLPKGCAPDQSPVGRAIRQAHGPEHRRRAVPARRPRIGKTGDYFTSVSVGPVFGRLLARQFLKWRAEVGPEFAVVEVGGHRGQLRADVLAAAPDLNYRVIEVGEPLPEAITGCVFSNEFLDALPVHRVCVASGTWHEVYVVEAEQSRTGVPLRQQSRVPPAGGSAYRRDLFGPVPVPPERGGGERDRQDACPTFAERLGPLSDPRLAGLLEDLPACLMEGYTTEINLRALDWLTDVAGRLRRGYLLTIDYGFERGEYFAPHHKDGHLQCYYRHTRNTDPYGHIGDQDITAHVEFSSLIELGRQLGLEPVRFTDQAHFLLETGETEIAAIVERTAGQVSRERAAVQQLLHSTMGHTFKVLIQRKG